MCPIAGDHDRKVPDWIKKWDGLHYITDFLRWPK